MTGGLTITGKAKIHAKFDINCKDFGIAYAGMADNVIRPGKQ